MRVAAGSIRRNPDLALAVFSGEGRLFTTGVSEAEMARAFLSAAGPGRGQSAHFEERSWNTCETALQVARLLTGKREKPRLLAISARHLPLAMAEPEAGLAGTKWLVTPHPVGFLSGKSTALTGYCAGLQPTALADGLECMTWEDPRRSDHAWSGGRHPRLLFRLRGSQPARQSACAAGSLRGAPTPTSVDDNLAIASQHDFPPLGQHEFPALSQHDFPTVIQHDFLEWPFFEERHRRFAADFEAWSQEQLEPLLVSRAYRAADLDARCRILAEALGGSGFLEVCAPEAGPEAFDVRSICLAREILARRSSLAEFVLAMQGLGSGPITLFGTPAQRARYLPAVRTGQSIAAFALSEPEAGSDVSAIATTATATDDGWVLDGEKTWISNGGIAQHYVMFARTGEAPGAKGLSAFIVPAHSPGLEIAERLVMMSPHPIARLALRNCRVRPAQLLGQPGEGFRIAMATLDVFRTSVAAAALGMARRALAEASAHAARRIAMGRPLIDHQMVQGKIADMCCAIDQSALLVYRSAWTRDVRRKRVTRESAMAKLCATEAAQKVIDEAVQIFGGLGVQSGMPVEELYRDIRALRIYEGASDIQRVIIARHHMASLRDAGFTGIASAGAAVASRGGTTEGPAA